MEGMKSIKSGNIFLFTFKKWLFTAIKNLYCNLNQMHSFYWDETWSVTYIWERGIGWGAVFNKNSTEKSLLSIKHATRSSLPVFINTLHLVASKGKHCTVIMSCRTVPTQRTYIGTRGKKSRDMKKTKPKSNPAYTLLCIQSTTP